MLVYKSSNTGKLYTIEPSSKIAKCPECSPYRKKKEDKCLKWYSDGGYCHHCETSFYEKEEKQEVFILPDWKNKTDLTDKAVKWFEGRGISQDVLKELKIYSDTEFMPKFSKEVEVICFPYFDGETLVNIKYRGAEKSFKLHKDSKRIFFNLNAIDKEVVIVEGELDVLAFYMAGVKNVLSVPNGAGKNLEYLDNCIEKFKDCESIYLAVDNDLKGLELRDELARRLGMDKCFIVNFKDCKDANEYLIKYSGLELGETIKAAKCYPIKGIVKASDIYEDLVNLYENGIQKGKEIGNQLIDEYVSWETGRLAIVTGIPGHGKSEFIDYLVGRLNILYGWKAAYFTPENYPLKFHYAKMYEKFIGDKFKKERTNTNEFDIAFDHLNNNVFYIMDEEDYTVETIIDCAKNLIKSRGIKILVIDPYNKLEHKTNGGESETQYISRFLDQLLMFSRFNDILVILVAHPVKMSKDKEGFFEVPTLYNISGSAHFFNKCDYGFCVYRTMKGDNSGYNNSIRVYWQKIKFKHLGESGVSYLDYNINNGRFEPSGIYDNSNWLVNQVGDLFEKEEDCPF